MENTRLKRMVIQGVVVSDKMDKTIVVNVETYRKHSKYGKRVKYAKKYYVHDEKNTAKVGDTVLFMGTRPLSKLKRFRLVKVTKKAVEQVKVNDAELDVTSKLKEVKAIEKEVIDKKLEAERKEKEAKEEAEKAAKKEAKKEAEKVEEVKEVKEKVTKAKTAKKGKDKEAK